MDNDLDPVIGNWYRHIDKGWDFDVVAVDEAAGTVEVQYIGGGVDEMDLAAWRGLELDRIEPPEDRTGPVDDVERDDLSYSETGMRPSDWSDRLREQARPCARRREAWQRTEPEEATDEWGETGSEEEPWEEGE